MSQAAHELYRLDEKKKNKQMVRIMTTNTEVQQIMSIELQMKHFKKAALDRQRMKLHSSLASPEVSEDNSHLAIAQA